MQTYIIRRLISSVVVLIIITMAVFFAMRILPGDPVYMIMSQGQMTNATIEEINALRHEYGLDKPIIVQYFNWMGNLFHGDLGTSITQRIPVSGIVAKGVPITLNMGIPAFIISVLIGVPAGIICAIRWGKWLDTLVTILANIGITIPVFLLGIILIYVFSLNLGWLPVQGYTSPFTDLVKNIKQLIMPVFCLSIFPISSITRQARSSMMEIMRQDYVRTAWSKGLRERTVVIKHAMKNSLIPVITLSGVSLSYIIGGSVFVEIIYNIQGVGRLLVNAVFAHDYPVVQGFILILSVMILMINLIVDVSYGWLDPRIRYS